MWKLLRKDYLKNGIFGELYYKGDFFGTTLEHAYEVSPGVFRPKVASGQYELILHPPTRLPYETYMLENVPNFQGAPVEGVLVHVGNFQVDTNGCICVGLGLGYSLKHLLEMITASQKAFDKFMALNAQAPKITMTIEDGLA